MQQHKEEIKKCKQKEAKAAMTQEHYVQGNPKAVKAIEAYAHSLEEKVEKQGLNEEEKKTAAHCNAMNEFLRKELSKGLARTM